MAYFFNLHPAINEIFHLTIEFKKINFKELSREIIK